MFSKYLVPQVNAINTYMHMQYFYSDKTQELKGKN